MGKHKNATKGRSNAQKGISPNPSSCVGEAGNTGHIVHDLRDKVVSLEEALLKMGASSKMPFHFAQCSRLPSEQSLSPEHQQSNPVPEDQMCYCIQVRVTLGEVGGDQLPPPHVWTGSLIVDMFQHWLKKWITGAVVLAPWEAILFFGWWLLKRGFLLVM